MNGTVVTASNPKKVLVADRFSPEGLRVFEEAENIDLDYRPELTVEELPAAIAEADALVVRGGTQVSATVIEAAPQLKVIARAGIGVGNVDMTAANRRGAVVMNTPFGSTTTTAEHTIAMLMALARQIPAASLATKSGRWEKDRFLGVEISGKTLGVVGAGKIGRLVVERALALKMKVLVFDPHLFEEVVRQMGAEQAEFDELLERCDFLSLHIPLNAETTNLIDEVALSKVKPGCRIINCAIGGLIDEPALAAAIQTGHIAGAALDVFAQEPPEPNNPLLALEEVICTPHLRAATVDAQINVTVQAAEQVVEFLTRGVIVNALNVPSVPTDLLEKIRPYVELCERLGAFQAQVCGKGVQRVEIEFAGQVTEHPLDPLTMALLKGLLTPMLGSSVNFVNAHHFARERGIHVTETRSDMSEGYASLIRLTVSGSEGSSSVWGALFRENDYRIVQVNGYPVEAAPDGHILMLLNDDRPGVVAYVSRLLSESGVNIAMMNLSRRKIQGKAVSLINVDSPIPETVLEQLRAHENIRVATQIIC
jgi:D-3-phosphoglycerate dehydrogenase